MAPFNQENKMDYKEKYEKALGWMRDVYPTLTGATKEDAEHYFPELAESEDERIREWIAEHIDCDERDRAEMMPKALAWLEKQKDIATTQFTLGQQAGREEVLYEMEKQKEQKPVEKESALTDFEETLNTFLFDFANSPIEDCEPKKFIKKHSAEILKAAYKELNAKLQQDIFEAKQEGRRDGYEVAKAEQKPAVYSIWKDTKKESPKPDSLILAIDDIGVIRSEYYEGDGYLDKTGGIKLSTHHTKWCYQSEVKDIKPAKWSEEDEKWLNYFYDLLKLACEKDIHNLGQKAIDAKMWLKSLRPHWKPSEEQPEVDLEKEYKTWWNSISSKINVEHIMEWYMHETARHFYELGLNARKEE